MTKSRGIRTSRDFYVTNTAGLTPMPSWAAQTTVPVLPNISSDPPLPSPTTPPHDDVYPPPEPPEDEDDFELDLPDGDYDDLFDEPPSTDGEDLGDGEFLPVSFIIRNSFILWAIFLSTGKRSLTEEQYTFVRSLVSCAMASNTSHWRAKDLSARLVAAARERAALPSYSTLLRSIRPKVFESLAPVMEPVVFPVSLIAVGALVSGTQEQDHPTASVPYIPPSNYAKLDVATPCIWSSFLSNDVLDTIPIIRRRDRFYCERNSVIYDKLPDSSGLFPIAAIGDMAYMTLLNQIHNAHPVLGLFLSVENSKQIIRGEVASIFLVQHSSRRHPSTTPTVLDYEGRLEDFFGYIRYKQPPRTSQRKSRGSSSSSPPTGSTRLPLIPGDLVLSLRPLTNRAAPASTAALRHSARVFLVHRFWANVGEFTRHFLVLHPDSTFTESETGYPWPTNFVRLYTGHNPNPRTGFFCGVPASFLKHVSKSSTYSTCNIPLTAPTRGILSDQRSYFIYRYLLYSDGFNTSQQNAASTNGVYMVPLNFPLQCRKSPSSSRIIAAVPPGVSPFKIYETLHKDIIDGRTKGFLVRNAVGEEIVLFMDLVGFFADTPALNGALDFGGHSATTNCHLCRLVPKSSTALGSLYANTVAFGSITGSRRFWRKHQAVRDSDPSLPTLQHLGFKQVPTSNNWVLRDIHRKISGLPSPGPRDDNGVVLFSKNFDPFVGSFIGPDHLIYGLARLSIQFAIFCLYPLEFREIFQRVLLRIIKDENNIPFPNAFIDIKKSLLTNLTMTHIFTLLAFGPVAYAITIQIAFGENIPPAPLAAMGVLRTLHNVYALLALPSHVLPDISRLQLAVRKYLATLRDVCKTETKDLKDADMPRRGKGGGARLAYKDLENLTRAAIRSLDVTNVHRLYEYVFFQLPMFRYPSMTRELPMEKLHLQLKRQLERSGAFHGHHYAIRSAVLDDWKSRLSLIPLPVGLNNNIDIIRFSVLLLAGSREARKVTPDYPLEALVTKINSILSSVGSSPIPFVKKGIAVFPRKASSPFLWTTTLRNSKLLDFNHSSFLSLPDILRGRLVAIAQARNLQATAIYVSTKVSNIPLYGKESAPIVPGKFLSVDCYHPNSIENHAPFVNQASRVCGSASTAKPSAMFWKVVAIFLPDLVVHESEVLFLVQPYLRGSQDVFGMNKGHHCRFNGYIQSSNSSCIMYADASVRAVASFEMEDNYIPTKAGCCLLFDRLCGYPPRQG